MRINEIINVDQLYESVELSSTLRSVASEIGNPVTAVYDKLKETAHKWSENHDSMEKFNFMEKNISNKWYHDRGENLISELHHLADQAPSQAASALRQALRNTHQLDFRSIGKKITPILAQIGKDTNYAHLVRNAEAWYQQEEYYDGTIAELDAYASSSKKRPAASAEPVPSMSTTRNDKLDKAATERNAQKAHQHHQIEQLINSVLTNLPKGIAGEIRNAIAKDNNKLYALHRELAKRHIKM